MLYFVIILSHTANKGLPMLSKLKNYSILYVEDEYKIQKLIAKYLNNYFSTVYVASDGEEALALYEEHRPNAMLLDINLPKLNGLDVAKKIRLENKHIKIIMLTAYAEQEKLLKATELKLTKYLLKPIDPQYFKEIMGLLAEELTDESHTFVHLAPHCVWDTELEILLLHNKSVKLTDKEQSLMKYLILKKGQVVSYEDIMIEVWDDAFEKEISIDAVKILVSRMRKKLPEDCITSVYGKGYTLQ
jgi:DNA-binding response OmpR family regulator